MLLSISKSKSKLDHNNCLILIVDDNPENLRLLSSILTSKGFKVKKTVNSEIAIEIAKKQNPDLILLDINMPDNEGYEFYRNLKSLEETVNIPIIFMGNVGQKADQIRSFEISRIDLITKPFQEVEILSRVQDKLFIYQQSRKLITYNQKLDKGKYEQQQLLKSVVNANQNLPDVANLNPLTKVASRRMFDEYLNLQWQKMICEKTSLSLLLCNVHFNNQNNNNSDACLISDNWLQQIARVIKSEVKRASDLLAIYENEKFAVILPNTNSKGAVYVAKLIQEKVDNLKINNPQCKENELFTLTIGVATVFPSAKMTPNTLIDMVEKAIDTAKSQEIT